MLPELSFGISNQLNAADLAKNYGTTATTSSAPTVNHKPTVLDAISYPSQFLMQTGRIFGYANQSEADTTPSGRAAQARDGAPLPGGFTPQADWDKQFQPGQIDIPAQRDRAPGMSYSWDNGPASEKIAINPNPSTDDSTIQSPYGTASVQFGNTYRDKLMKSFGTMGYD